MGIFCYGDKSHIRVHPHIKYFPGAAKNVVTGHKYIIFVTYILNSLPYCDKNFLKFNGIFYILTLYGLDNIKKT